MGQGRKEKVGGREKSEGVPMRSDRRNRKKAKADGAKQFIFMSSGKANKAFRNLVYDRNMCEYHINYCLINLEDNITNTETNT